MKDLRVEIKIKNAILYREIKSRYESIAKFCRERHFHQTDIGRLLSFKCSPILGPKKYRKVNGAREVEGINGHIWSRLASRLSKELCIAEEELFPEALREIRKSSYAFELESSSLIEAYNQDYIGDISKKELTDRLDFLLGTLTEKEKHIITENFALEGGEEKTFVEIGRELNVSGTRIKQLLDRAMKKLRHPSRTRYIRPYLDA